VKVLVFTSSFPRFADSHEGRWILELAQSLTRFGYIPLVLAPHFLGGKIHEQWGDIRIVRFVYFIPFRFETLAYGPGLLFNIRRDFFAFLGCFPFLKSGFLFSLLLFMKEDPAIIHTHWLIPQGFAGAVFHRIWKVPHVATVHGSDLNLITSNKILAPVGRFIVRETDIITVNSAYTRRQLESFAPETLNKIRVIPMGIDPEKYRQGPFSDLKNKYRIDHLVLSVGRLIDWKGTVYLIEAMPGVLRHFPETLLLIAGTGPEKESLVRRVRELGLESRVKFLGVVDTRELISLYQSADVFILPSISKNGKTEALGVVLLEAMASGCPVIGSNVGGIPDIILDGNNGFLVPEKRPDLLAEKIVRILSDNKLQEKFRKNGLMHVEKLFSWEKISADFSRVFDGILKNQKKRKE
jgi:glycosyltransferase involved in cell wall biosynthesis